MAYLIIIVAQVSHLEDRFRRNIRKSQPYFDAKQICQDQLNAQKERIQELQQHTKLAKARYAGALKNLEHISDDIHRQRSSQLTETSATQRPTAEQRLPPDAPQTPPPPPGPREPGVGSDNKQAPQFSAATHRSSNRFNISTMDVNAELDRCCSDDATARGGTLLGRAASLMNVSALVRSNSNSSTASHTAHQQPVAANAASTPATAKGCLNAATSELDLERLRHRVKELAVRPVEVGDGRPEQDAVWETELNDTVNQLDRLMLMRETGLKYIRQTSQTCMAAVSMPTKATLATKPAKAAAPADGVTVGEMPLLQRWSNEIAERTKRFQLGRRSSLE